MDFGTIIVCSAVIIVVYLSIFCTVAKADQTGEILPEEANTVHKRQHDLRKRIQRRMATTKTIDL
jgi:uncharacterized protein YpmB